MYHEYPWLWCMTGDYESTTWLIFTRLIRTAVMYSRLLTSKHPNFNTDLLIFNFYICHVMFLIHHVISQICHMICHMILFSISDSNLSDFFCWSRDFHFLIRFWFQFFFWNKKTFRVLNIQVRTSTYHITCFDIFDHI